MNDFVRQQLQYIITQYGRAVCDDPRRCEALLKDLCPENKREVNVLVIALKSKVAEDLMKASASIPKELLFTRLLKRLEDDYGLAEKISFWAIESWASALGIVSGTELSVLQALIPAEVRQKKPIQIRENEKLDISEVKKEEPIQVGIGKKPDKKKYQIRSKPISTDDPVSAFRLNEEQKPLEYVENDFKDNGNGTITNPATGLMWQKSGSPNPMNYEKAKVYVENLNREGFAGHKDWRFPTVDELKSLITPEEQLDNPLDPFIDPIFDKMQSWCWTSDQRTSGGAWLVGFGFGGVDWCDLNLDNYVRAVRSV